MFQALYAHASAANQHLHSEMAQLQQKKTILMTERDHLNQTLEIIFQFNNFPVDHFCPVTDSLTQGRQKLSHLYGHTAFFYMVYEGVKVVHCSVISLCFSFKPQ